MDRERFDHLTRRLAHPLPRRRLLRRAASALAGVALAGRAARILAACDTPPNCPEGYKSCGGCSCIPENGVCCTENVYCPPHTICCGNGAGGWNCCAQSEFSQEICCGNALCCLVGLECGPDGCRSPCPAGTSRCGETCCSSAQECISDTCQSACAAGTTRCGTSNCCGAQQTCAAGAVRGRLPGRSRRATGRRAPIAPAGDDGGGGMRVVPGRPSEVPRPVRPCL